MPYLVFDDNATPKAIPIAAGSDGEFKIGRSLNNNLRLRGDTSISRLHCSILRHDDKFALKDTSSNGTLVGDNLVSGDMVEIRDGDSVAVGNFIFTFHASDSPPYPSTDTTTINLEPLIAPATEAMMIPSPMTTFETIEDDELVFQETAQLAPIQLPNSKDNELSKLPEITGFEIIRTLGTGTHSTTHLAFQAGLKRTVALKVFKVENDGPQPKKFFLENVQATGSLSHKSIVPFFDAGHVDNLYFIAMHYAVGGNLRHKLKKSGPIPPKTVVEVGTAIIEALSQLEDIRALHANITPNNILFSENNEPMLADTGLSHWVASVFQTERNVFQGNPAYMPPEQALDAGIDWTCDQYSLGAVLFEMLTGIQPFTAPSLDLLIRKHLKEKLHFPDKSKIPTPLKNTLAKMMAKSPDRRFASWDDVIAALSVKAKPHPPSPRPKKGVAKAAPNRGKPKNNITLIPKKKKPAIKIK